MGDIVNLNYCKFKKYFLLILLCTIWLHGIHVRAINDKIIVVESHAVKSYLEGKEVEVKNIDFFDKDLKIRTESESALIEYLNLSKPKDNQIKIRIFAIGDFRDLPGISQSTLIANIFIKTGGLKLNIIPQYLEHLIFENPRHVFKSVVICGSFRKHIDKIDQVKRQLESNGVRVLAPVSTVPVNPGANFVFFEGEETTSPLELENLFLDRIRECDAVIVCCPGGYVGTSASTEIGFARCLGKRIIFTEQPEDYIFNIIPSEIL